MSRKYCPFCDDYKDVIQLETIRVLVVKGRYVSVFDKPLKCLECEKEFDDPKSKYDILKEAYIEHNRLYPDDPVKIKDAQDVKKDMGL